MVSLLRFPQFNTKPEREYRKSQSGRIAFWTFVLGPVLHKTVFRPLGQAQIPREHRVSGLGGESATSSAWF